MKQEEEAIAGIFQLLSPQSHSFVSGTSFSTEKCKQVPITAWAALLLMDQPVTHTIDFAPGCDVKMTFTLEKNKKTRQSGELRNFHDFTRFDMNVLFTVAQDPAGVKIRFETDDGKLFSKGSAGASEFTGAYGLVGKLEGAHFSYEQTEGKIVLKKYRGKAIEPRTLSIPGR